MSPTQKPVFRQIAAALCAFVILLVSGCNLSGAPDQQEILLTETLNATLLPSRTPVSTSGLPATAQLPTFLPTTGAFATAQIFPPIVIVPTSQPPVILPPTSFPLNIAILSPGPGNIVASNVQVLGSASHPQFLQYQLEFGPDPNPGNLWFPATSPLFTPVLNNLLGIWNTNGVQDARYQLRLRVYLRDGRIEQTVIGNITVQNRVNTPIPSPTQEIPRPIAAFTQDVTTGQVPLTVRYSNQSTGSINTHAWNFGDGTTSSEVSPTHIYGSPGLYTVTLTVTGPGGSSNVSRQISVNSPSAPSAGFTQDFAGGVAPLTVQFVDQSSGSITSYQWNFSDGGLSSERNPRRTFTAPGTYNIILTVAGPGGSSSVIRQISVTSAIPASLTPTWTWTPSPIPTTQVAATATFVPTLTATNIPPTGVPFTETPIPTATLIPSETPIPTATFTGIPSETPIPTATFTGIPSETPIPTATFTEIPSETPIPTATFTEIPSETPIPTATFTEIPSETPIPTATFTEIPSETPIPTATFTEIPTETPVPTETPAVSNPADNLPVYPDMSDARIGGTAQTGIALGNRSTVFAYVGGQPIAQSDVLRPFAPGGFYNASQQPDLIALIDTINQTDLGGTTSFSRASVAAGADWIAADLLDPNRADLSVCTAGETPLDCELRLIQPAIVFIAVGANDIARGVDVFSFETTLRQIIDIANARGVIPVVLTLTRSPAVDAMSAAAFNDVIIRAAKENGALLLNVWGLLGTVPGFGDSGFGLNVAPTGAGDLDSASVEGYGANAVNLALLRTLANIRGTFFP